MMMLNTLNKIKAWLITAGVFILAVITLGGYARHQKRRAEKAEQQNKQHKEVINRARQTKEIAHDAYRLDADELDKRLQQDYRD